MESLTTVKPKSVKAKGRALQNCLRDKLREAFPGLHEDDIKPSKTLMPRFQSPKDEHV